MTPNNAINTDVQKRRFALLLHAGYGERYLYKRIAMNKTITIIVLLSLGLAINSYAADNDRIDELEKQVQELRHRVSKLEALLNKSDATPSKPDATKDGVTSGDDLKLLSIWKKLSPGMSHEDVRKLLGEPSKTRGADSFETWNYPNSGYVMFKYGRVFSWNEPSP